MSQRIKNVSGYIIVPGQAVRNPQAGRPVTGEFPLQIDQLTGMAQAFSQDEVHIWYGRPIFNQFQTYWL